LKLLIIEDEPSLRDSITDYFTEEGIICETSANISSALEKTSLYNYDCILLDIGLPDGDGLKLLEKLKDLGKEEGIIIISARNSLDDRITGLDHGADDYLVKPFHLAELKARVASVYRRKVFKGNNMLQYEDISIDLWAMDVKINGNTLSLTKKEYDMLLYFIANKGKVIGKNAIAENLWKDEIDLVDNFDFIYTHIKNLRKKLADLNGKDFIKSVYGVGYKFS
jgi:DNA-binding response OmpR family regulator